MRDQLSTASGMCPDRIIMTDLSDQAGHDFLESLNTGRNGDMAIVTARSPKHCLRRLESMVRLGGLPSDSAQEIIADNVQVIIQTQRFPDGSCKVSEIAEVVGLANGQPILSTLYQLKFEGPDEKGTYKREFIATGNKSRWVEKFDIYSSGRALDISSEKFR